MIKVLWLSRHALTEQQIESFPIGPRSELQFIHINPTFPARSKEAIEMIRQLMDEHKAHLVAGVFPAHIAAALAYDRTCDDDKYFKLPVIRCAIYFPVSVPAAAKDGEVRGGGFAHSHWEWTE